MRDPQRAGRLYGRRGKPPYQGLDFRVGSRIWGKLTRLGLDWVERTNIRRRAPLNQVGAMPKMRHVFRNCANADYGAASRRMKRGSPCSYRYLKVDSDNLRRELYVTAVGSQDCPAGRHYPTPGHPDGYNFDWNRGRVLGDFAIVLLSRGSGAFETRTGRYVCRARDALLIPPGVWHRYRPDIGTGWREHWVCANGEFLHRLSSKRRFFSEATVLHAVASDRLQAAHRRIWNFVRRREPANDLALAAGALELFALALQAGRAHDTHSAPAPATGDPVSDAAQEYIWFNSHRPLTVSLIARHVGATRRTLQRHYVRANGVTVVHEVIARRVERARQLLLETQMSVKEISYAVGFGDSRRLIRNFTRKAGLTPAAFRRREVDARGAVRAR
jgi:AraC-like DNA-binding protein